MTFPSRVKKLIELMLERLVDHECSAQCHSSVRNPTADQATDHATWMLESMLGEPDRFNVPKANRWIGFVQGILWAHGLVSIDKLKEWSRDLWTPESRSVYDSVRLTQGKMLVTDKETSDEIRGIRTAVVVVVGPGVSDVSIGDKAFFYGHRVQEITFNEKIHCIVELKDVLMLLQEGHDG